MNQETTTYDHMYRPGVITVNVADLRRWLKIVSEVQYGRKRADRYFYLWKNDVVSDLEVMVGEHLQRNRSHVIDRQRICSVALVITRILE